MRSSTTEVSFREAIIGALAGEMRRDSRVVLLGEDVGAAGGAFKETDGLFDEFGPLRVWDSPISEQAIVGAALGAAITGLRPVVNLMFIDFAMVALDAIANEAAKYRFMSGGQFSVPVVIRAACGGGLSFAAQHSQTLEWMFTGMAGLKVVAPATPSDARGLLRAAIRDDNPVIFLEHKALYNKVKDTMQSEEGVTPLGVARTARVGRDVTIVATMAMVHQAVEAATTLAREGIEAEVIDLRSLVPLDTGTIYGSLARTNRLIIVEEAPRTGGWGASIAALVNEEAFDSLDAPVTRVCLDDVPLPYSPTLEARALPDAARIVGAVRRLLGLAGGEQWRINSR
jgi:pyruvate/2-oxoglutarate/acetoin dehydrogenase E1 component